MSGSGTVAGDDRVERLEAGGVCGGGPCEGPVYVLVGRNLLVSDIPNDRILRWAIFIGASASSGIRQGMLDAEGRLVTCGARRPTSDENRPHGLITVLADRFRGPPPQQPHDVVVRSDGSVWFT